MKGRRGALASGLLQGLLLGLAGGLIWITPFGVRFEENTGLATLFEWRGAVTPPGDVAVVAIDSRTLKDLSLPRDTRDWDRAVHACLIDKLVALGAAVIVFDVAFVHSGSSGKRAANRSLPEPVRRLCPDTGQRESSDAKLAHALRQAGKVVLVQPLAVEKTESWTREQLVPLTPEIADAALAIAPFPLPKLPADVSQFWSFKSSIGDMPTLPVVALQARLQSHPVVKSKTEHTDRTLSHSRQLQVTMQELRRHAADVSLDTLDARLVALYKGPESYYLNFYGPPKTIRTISYADILASTTGEPNSPDLNEAVVFVGVSTVFTPQQRDGYHTVFTTEDGIDISGVEIAASAFGNLAEGRLVEKLDNLSALCLLIAFATVLGVIGNGLPATMSIPLTLLVGAAYAYLVLSVFADTALWLPLAVPLILQLPAAMLLSMLARYVGEKKQRQVVAGALNRYVPEAIARQILDSGGDLQRTRVEATLLYCDIAGFSTISEHRSPDVVAEMLDEYFAAVAKPIVGNGGVIVQFQGDALLATFNVPARIANHPDAALRAAMSMVNIAAHSTFAGVPISIRIGIDTGEVAAGNVGSGDRLIYTVHGDAVNVSARLEQYNKELGTEILISANTVTRLNDVYPLESVGMLTVRGREQPLLVYKCNSVAMDLSG